MTEGATATRKISAGIVTTFSTSDKVPASSRRHFSRHGERASDLCDFSTFLLSRSSARFRNSSTEIYAAAASLVIIRLFKLTLEELPSRFLISHLHPFLTLLVGDTNISACSVRWSEPGVG